MPKPSLDVTAAPSFSKRWSRAKRKAARARWVALECKRVRHRYLMHMTMTGFYPEMTAEERELLTFEPGIFTREAVDS